MFVLVCVFVGCLCVLIVDELVEGFVLFVVDEVGVCFVVL